jgi:hypothetical protein
MRRPRGALWSHRDFLKLWAGQTISEFGSQVSQLAIPAVAVLTLKASPFQVAALGTVEFLPFLLFTLPAGVWVDRWRRRWILIAGDLGRAVLLASIPLAYLTGHLSLTQLYVVGFLVGIHTVFFDVAYQSYLPQLVDRETLVEGNSKLQMTFSGAAIVGRASRWADRALHRAVRGPRRRVQLPRLRRVHGRDPQARGSAARDRAPQAVRRALGRASVRGSDTGCSSRRRSVREARTSPRTSSSPCTSSTRTGIST